LCFFLWPWGRVTLQGFWGAGGRVTQLERWGHNGVVLTALERPWAGQNWAARVCLLLDGNESDTMVSGSSAFGCYQGTQKASCGDIYFEVAY
jgi:hypothetical protein